MAHRFDLDEWSTIGNVLLRNRKITQKQIDAVLVEQRRRNGAQTFGDLAVELGFATRDDVNAALREQTLHRLPPVSAAALKAERLMATAFASFEREAERVCRKRKEITSTNVVVLPISQAG